MNFKTLFAIALVSLGLAYAAPSAAALGPVVAQAHEISLENFSAPATENGGATFSKCNTCQRQTVRVSGGTRYVVNGSDVRLEDFRKALSQVRSRDDVTLTVVHHLESDTITKISVSL